MIALAAGCLVLAAVVVAVPNGGPRARPRRVLTVPGVGARVMATFRRGIGIVVRVAAARSRQWGPQGSDAWCATYSGVPAALAGWFAGGPVAAGVVGAYTAVAAVTLRRRARRRATETRQAALRDAIGAAAAELRAGLPPAMALADVVIEPSAGFSGEDSGGRAAGGPGSPADDHDALRARVTAAVRLTELTGAPLADLLERTAAHARGLAHTRAAAAAHAAGARATAGLLTCLPVAGVLLGYAIGAAPLDILLHTPFGAACATVAVALQLAGIGWAGRIARAPQAVPS